MVWRLDTGAVRWTVLRIMKVECGRLRDGLGWRIIWLWIHILGVVSAIGIWHWIVRVTNYLRFGY